MLCISKIFIFSLCCSYIYRSSKNSGTNQKIQNHFYLKNNSKPCNHSYEYSKIEKLPTENEEGRKMYLCKYCRNKYFEKIPKLNKENYKVENLTSNCENGNGVRYSSNLYGKYDLTDKITQLHSIYGKKCDECHKLIGEFDFKTLGPLKCTGYPRLIRLSEYWNHYWLLGGNFGFKVGCRISRDEGYTWTEPIDISQFPNHICSNIDLFELPNHDIISTFRAVGRYDSHVQNIKYNRMLGCSISHDGGYTWKNIGSIIDNFELAKKLGVF